MGIPATLDWAAVLLAITDFLSNGLIVGGVTASMAILFAPKIIRALRRAVGSR